jgi:hypothetical protein
LRIIKEHFAKLQVLVWAPLNYPVTQDEDGFSSSSSGFSIGSRSGEEGEGEGAGGGSREDSFHKTERYAFAMFDAVPALRMFISYRKGPCYVWRREPARAPGGDQGNKPPLFERAWLEMGLDEDTFRVVDPDHPMELFTTNVPHGPPLAEPRILRVYNVPTPLPVHRSTPTGKTFQDL